MRLALLRKDLHLFRLPLAAGLVLAVVPYLFAIDDVVAGRTPTAPGARRASRSSSSPASSPPARWSRPH